MRSDSRRFEAIVFGTLVDFIETLKSAKSRRSMSSTYSTAAVTSASTGLENSRSRRCLGSEPEFTPIRSGVPSSRACATTSPVFSGPPMLPGLIRTQCAPASSALIASVWLKWMSAITGIGDSATIVRSAATSCSRGTATRTMSAPASATRRIWSIVACEVGRLGLRHRLHGDGRAAPDRGRRRRGSAGRMPCAQCIAAASPAPTLHEVPCSQDVYATARGRLRARVLGPLAANARRGVTSGSSR